MVFMQAMVLAAGLGTRLKPLTDVLPKPLVPIGDRTALAHVVETVRMAGAKRIVVNTHFAKDEVEHEARALGALISHEEVLLGTAGGVAKASSFFDPGDLLVCTADVVTKASLAPLFERGTADATLLVESCSSGSGNVGIDGEGWVVRLRQTTVRKGEVRGAYSLGIQVLSAGLRDALPTTGCLVADLYLPTLQKGLRLAAREAIGSWTDVGTVFDYMRANEEWLSDQKRDVFQHQTSSVAANIRLDRTILGRRVVVRGSGLVKRVVAWPGSIFDAPLSNAIVCREGMIVSVPA